VRAYFLEPEIERMLIAYNVCRRNLPCATWILSCLALLMLARTARADFPDRPAPQTLEGGIQFFDVSVSGDAPGQSMRFWAYLPPGDHPAKSLPCVFVAPAGTPFITGQRLGIDDRPEHLPYVKAGFAVIAYELDGQRTVHTDAALLAAISQFMAVHGGVDNAHTAVDYALVRMPEIDPERLYAAGHSSAANLALDVAAADPRIKACCAYAPCPDLRKRLKPRFVASVSQKLPEFGAFIDSASPSQHIDELKAKPVMLFTAADDKNIPTQSVRDFAADLRQAGAAQVKLVTADSGGHHQSMIDMGIPAGIEFLKELRATPNN
jgi:dipeptidyl aminopeptidase/acylaminoacyl peptidase